MKVQNVLITGGAAFAEQVRGYRPDVHVDEGLARLTKWLEGQMRKAKDRAAEAKAERAARGLAR